MKNAKNINVKITFLLFAALCCFSLLSGLDYYEVIDQVKLLKGFLAYETQPPEGSAVTEADVQNRKAEIRNEINALLASTRKTYSTRNLTMVRYIYAKGTAEVKNEDLGNTLFIQMTEQQYDTVSRNTGNYHLEAVKELNYDLEWFYYNWVLKGSTTIYHEEEPEPVENIPSTEELETNPEARAEISEYHISKDNEAQEAIQSFEDADYEESLEYFETAVEATDNPQPEYLYWIGLNYLAEGIPDAALMWFQKYLDSGNQLYVAEAARYVLILTEQKNVFSQSSVNEFPVYLATPYGETHFVISPDGEQLYFSAYSELNPGQTDIFRCNKLNNEWDSPVRQNRISTDKDEALCSFSIRGNRAYLQGMYEAGKTDFDIYYSDFRNDWQPPVNIGNVNSQGQDIDPYVYSDLFMFFSSDRPGGLGGFDLYYSVYANGVWGRPVNLGPGVNTTGNETAPFLDWDGKTLFFCSDGWTGLGGKDIYKLVILASDFSSVSCVENIGVPLNTHRDDMRFYHLKNSNQAIILSNRKASRVPNMYKASLDYAPRGYYVQDTEGKKSRLADSDNVSPLTGKVPSLKEEENFFILRGRITNDKQVPLTADLNVIYDLNEIRYVKTVRSGKEGNFQITLPLSIQYELECNLNGYHKFFTQVTPRDKESERALEIVLVPLELEKTYIIPNIQFEFDSAKLVGNSFTILNEVAQTLLSNPQIRVEISGHTCNTGTDAYNMKLSRNRAESVVNYLSSRGVAADRMIYQGYGPSRPLTDNSTEELKEKNRRVEIKVIE